jgi:hypothetical protein|tara:strand:- start:21836 stop:21946 length:111 start_codon:yes stop_codon:yes gene_type:complete
MKIRIEVELDTQEDIEEVETILDLIEKIKDAIEEKE